MASPPPAFFPGDERALSESSSPSPPPESNARLDPPHPLSVPLPSPLLRIISRAFLCPVPSPGQDGQTYDSAVQPSQHQRQWLPNTRHKNHPLMRG